MGIEPTWDFVEPHAGFEDQDRHQPGKRFRVKDLAIVLRYHFNCRY